MLYHYHVFGLQLVSEIELSGLPPAESAPTPQVSIRCGELPEHLPGSPVTRRYFEASQGQLLVRIKDVGRILVAHGENITFEPLAGVEPVFTQLALLNLGMGALLHQRGVLALHASAIATQQGAVLFCGHRRAGKSTLAAGLRQRGWSLVCDDKAAINLDGEHVMVLPSFPELRLWRDAIEHLGVTGKTVKQMPKMDKFNLELEGGFHGTPLPLRAVYLLEPEETNRITLMPLTGMDKFQTLQRHTYANQFLKSLGLLPAHFRLASVIAQQIPITRITRPNQVNLLDELVDRIDAELRRL